MAATKSESKKNDTLTKRNTMKAVTIHLSIGSMPEPINRLSCMRDLMLEIENVLDGNSVAYSINKVEVDCALETDSWSRNMIIWKDGTISEK